MLAAIVTPSLFNRQRKAMIRTTKISITGLEGALGLYAAEHEGEYPIGSQAEVFDVLMNPGTGEDGRAITAYVEQLPADETDDAFETVAETQQLSHFHLDKYLAAADAALDEAFQRVGEGDDAFHKTYGPKELTANTGGGNYRGPDARNGQVITWPTNVQFSGRMPATRVRESGWWPR